MIYSRKFQFAVLIVGVILANIYAQLNLTKLPAPDKSEIWLVKRAVNGQVLEVQSANDANAKIERVVLAGVNAPLSDQQPWGDMARQYLNDTLKDKQVKLLFDGEKIDMSERPLAYVWLGDRSINREIIAEGYGLSQKIANNSGYQPQLDAAQTKARLLEVGIWNLDKPMRQTPRGFRR
jgi:micrococcal nuclease